MQLDLTSYHICYWSKLACIRPFWSVEKVPEAEGETGQTCDAQLGRLESLDCAVSGVNGSFCVDHLLHTLCGLSGAQPQSISVDLPLPHATNPPRHLILRFFCQRRISVCKRYFVERTLMQAWLTTSSVSRGPSLAGRRPKLASVCRRPRVMGQPKRDVCQQTQLRVHGPSVGLSF